MIDGPPVLMPGPYQLTKANSGEHRRMRKALKERFDEKWMPEPYSGRHLWTGAVSGNG
jgi:hypothetical protein